MIDDSSQLYDRLLPDPVFDLLLSHQHPFPLNIDQVSPLVVSLLDPVLSLRDFLANQLSLVHL